MNAAGVEAVSIGDIVEELGVGASKCGDTDGEVGEGVGELWRHSGVKSNNLQASIGGNEGKDERGGGV